MLINTIALMALSLASAHLAAIETTGVEVWYAFFSIITFFMGVLTFANWLVNK